MTIDPIRDGGNWKTYLGGVGDPVGFVDLWGLSSDVAEKVKLVAQAGSGVVASRHVAKAIAQEAGKELVKQVGVRWGVALAEPSPVGEVLMVCVTVVTAVIVYTEVRQRYILSSDIDKAWQEYDPEGYKLYQEDPQAYAEAKKQKTGTQTKTDEEEKKEEIYYRGLSVQDYKEYMSTGEILSKFTRTGGNAQNKISNAIIDGSLEQIMEDHAYNSSDPLSPFVGVTKYEQQAWSYAQADKDGTRRIAIIRTKRAIDNHMNMGEPEWLIPDRIQEVEIMGTQECSD